MFHSVQRSGCKDENISLTPKIVYVILVGYYHLKANILEGNPKQVHFGMICAFCKVIITLTSPISLGHNNSLEQTHIKFQPTPKI